MNISFMVKVKILFLVNDGFIGPLNYVNGYSA